MALKLGSTPTPAITKMEMGASWIVQPSFFSSFRPHPVRIGRRAKLLLFALLRLKASIASSCKFRLELFDASSGIDVLQLARIERMASRANVDLQFFAYATGHERVATTTSDLGFVVVRVGAFFHGEPALPCKMLDFLSVSLFGYSKNPPMYLPVLSYSRPICPQPLGSSPEGLKTDSKFHDRIVGMDRSPKNVIVSSGWKRV